MIRTANEYQLTLNRIDEFEQKINSERIRLEQKGRTPAEIKRLTDPSNTFLGQLKHDAQAYERLLKGEFPRLQNFEGLGPTLIALRIHKGLSQRELAELLGVHESQVSRDERNEYYGITVERAQRILKAMGAELQTQVIIAPQNKLKQTAV